MERDSFIFYKSFAESARILSPKERAAFYEALIDYALFGEEPNIKGTVKALFVIAKQSIDSNNKKYEQGKKGGRPKIKGISNSEKTDGFENKKPMVFEKENQKENQRLKKIKSTVTDTVTDTETVTVTDTDYYCSEQTSDEVSPEQYADVEALPLNDGTEWFPTVSQFEEFQRLYPAVNVRQAFADMRGWCNGNPKKRKTGKGIIRFVNSWLSREQDKYHPGKSGSTGPKVAVPDYIEKQQQGFYDEEEEHLW